MGQRLDLSQRLHDILGSDNVYFQPPAKKTINYPCIVYARNEKDEKFADNMLYQGMKRYSITVIDSNPDSTIPDKVASLPYTSFANHFVVDNLNHDVYYTYF